jgi:hypothetical protein
VYLLTSSSLSSLHFYPLLYLSFNKMFQKIIPTPDVTNPVSWSVYSIYTPRLLNSLFVSTTPSLFRRPNLPFVVNTRICRYKMHHLYSFSVIRYYKKYCHSHEMWPVSVRHSSYGPHSRTPGVDCR